MAAVVNTAIVDSLTFVDTAGAPVTGKADGDFTKSAYLMSNPSTTASVTIAAVSGQSGEYAATFTPTAAGRWRVRASCTHNGHSYHWAEDFDVLTPAQADPAGAVADAVLGAAADDYDDEADAGTIGYRLNAIFKRGITFGDA